jgi:GntR family transcriptional regulator/MocR family aminotransferase
MQNDQPKSLDAADLPLVITTDHPEPQYLQLANQLQALIDSRVLRAGTKLPATRVLARTLGINRNTVVAAFERLTSLGWIDTRGRGGSVVSDLARQTQRAEVRPTKRPNRVRRECVAAKNRSGAVIDFRLGSADPTPLPLEVWRRACRAAGRRLPDAGYGNPQGDAELRTQIARYLGRTRALRVEPGQVVITSGAGQAIERIAAAVLHPGDLAVVEEPGYPRAARAFEGSGARVEPVAVDEDGIDTSALLARRRAPKLIHVTPSHQYPLGSRLSAARRQALIQWAREHDVLVIENDYDGEFRYESAPLPALAALGGFGHVAYVGTFSKVLSPAMRLGFLVGRPELVAAITRAIAEARDSVSIVTQRIVTSLISSGELERHIRRTRRSYAARRAAMLKALESISEVEGVSGHAAGLHVVVKCRAGALNTGAFECLERQGIRVDRLADFQRTGADPDTLLMAYGHLTEADIARGAARLADVLR